MIKEESTSELLRFTLHHLLNQLRNNLIYHLLEEQRAAAAAAAATRQSSKLAYILLFLFLF